MGLTKDGAFFYRTPGSFMKVYTAVLDPETGNVAGAPMKEPLPHEGHNRWPSWSYDGKRLAYTSARPTIVGPFQPGRARDWIISVYSAETGKVQEFPHETVFAGPLWSGDGRHLYVRALTSGGGVFRMDAQSGEVAPLYGQGAGVLRNFDVSADGKEMVYGRRIEKTFRVVRRDPGTGEEKELDQSLFYLCALALSPDGSRLAWIMQTDKQTKVLKVMPFPDGTAKEIRRLNETGGSSEIAWSPDGRFIYYSDRPPEGGADWRLWRIPAEGGIPQDVGLGVSDFEGLSVHPDGLRITFSTGQLDREPSQVWIMENFLPAAKEKK
jgi:Tol biopolymer transport system component